LGGGAYPVLDATENVFDDGFKAFESIEDLEE
jgi:hypothetical protein